MQLIKFFLFLFYFNIVHSQEIDVSYYEIGGDRPKSLIFKNDSLVNIVPYRPHLLSKSEIETKNYKKLEDDIYISFGESIEKFQIIGKALVNYSSRKVLVLRNDFKKEPAIFIYFKDEFYETGKRNRKLKRLLKKLDENNLEIKVITGFDAYEKFGYEYSFGVIQIEEK